jgi:hypothetical protein
MSLFLANYETKACKAISAFGAGREDAPESRAPVRDHSPHFPVMPDFQSTSYLERYHLLCRKLMHEQLYTAACVLATPRSSIKSGKFTDHDDLTSLRSFVTTLAGHIAAELRQDAE